MQANEMQDFAGHSDSDVVGTLGGSLGHRTTCGGVLLPPLEGLLPFLGFVPLGFLHRDSSPARLHRPGDTSGEHVATLSRTRRVYLHGLRSSMGISSCRDDTLERAAKALPPLLADRRKR